MSIEKHISRLFEEIKSTKNSIQQSVALNEDIAFASPLNRKLIVTSRFGPRRGELHNGVDLVANAENVKSVADGKVIETAADSKLCGGKIVIKHSNGYQTGYCHMMKINVVAGQIVKRGDVIGVSGGGLSDPGKGRTTGRHLHFTLRKDDIPIDPMKFLDKDSSEIVFDLSSDNDEKFEFAGYKQDVDDDGNNIVSTELPSDKEDEFEFAGFKKKVTENIKRIKKML
jgi:hypothetical protein